MNVKWMGSVSVVVVLVVAATGWADLNVIGTATYNGSQYNLIWDNDSALVWLDYSNPAAYWANQKNWAAGLDAQLVYNFDPTYNVTWSDPAWRLPSAGGNPGGNFHAATQELGDLYYNKLGFAGGSANSGVAAPDLAGSIFQNLSLAGYWTSTAGQPIFSTNPAWMFAFKETRIAPYFDTVYGYQDVDATSGSFFGIPLAVKHCGLAVRGVSDVSVVPVPAALPLALLGLGSLAPLLRRRRAC
ncbi:MAG: hypothetical protein GX591_17595 [Planctomycetes bacterium]|nr:hypothetical protein [Planctomycetota bacterium]